MKILWYLTSLHIYFVLLQLKPVNGAGQENAAADPTILRSICVATVEFNVKVDFLHDVVGLGHMMQHFTCVAEETLNSKQD